MFVEKSFVEKKGKFAIGLAITTCIFVLASGLYYYLHIEDSSKKYYLHCAGGYRSVIMCSILKSRGFDKLANIEGGFEPMKSAGIKVASSPLAH